MRIVLTGCSSGLGAALARKLCDAGEVHGVDKANPLSAFFATDGRFYLCDLAEENEIRNVTAAIGRTKDKQLPVDVLINCAGIASIDYFEDTTTDDWDRVMAINARAPFLMTRYLRKSLAMTEGLVLNISSDAGTRPMTASLAYCASKAALDQMTRVMARELTRRFGIAVAAIAPGKIAGTPMSRYVDFRVGKVRGWTPEYIEKYHRAGVLMRHDIRLEALADFICRMVLDRHQWESLSGRVIPYGG